MPVKTDEQVKLERARGWIIKILDKERPDPVELVTLRETLYRKNVPLTDRALGAELDYLRSLGLLRVFPLGEKDELNNVEQAKLIQDWYTGTISASSNVCVCARITALGINFQAGLIAQATQPHDLDGITRVS